MKKIFLLSLFILLGTLTMASQEVSKQGEFNYSVGAKIANGELDGEKIDSRGVKLDVLYGITEKIEIGGRLGYGVNEIEWTDNDLNGFDFSAVIKYNFNEIGSVTPYMVATIGTSNANGSADKPGDDFGKLKIKAETGIIWSVGAGVDYKGVQLEAGYKTTSINAETTLINNDGTFKEDVTKDLGQTYFLIGYRF